MRDGLTKIRPPLPEVVVDVDRRHAGCRGPTLETREWRCVIESACATRASEPSNARSLMTSISRSAVPETGDGDGLRGFGRLGMPVESLLESSPSHAHGPYVAGVLAQSRAQPSSDRT